MSTNSPDVGTGLLTAAGVLPAHFADSENLRLETLDPIQATTLSLPGGAFAVETNLQGAGNTGSVVFIVTGLVDHAKGEVFDRSEARALWTAALTEVLGALAQEIGEFKNGQVNMTDAFDALEKSDESAVVGIFRDATLAGLLVAMPKEATGQGAAAGLAAEIAQAEAQEAGEDDAAAEGDAAAEAGSADAPEAGPEQAQAGAEEADQAAGPVPAGAAPGVPPAGMMPPGADPYAAQFGVPAYPGPGYAQSMSPEEAAAAAAQAAAARAAAQPLTSAPQFQPLYGGMSMAPDPRRIELLRDVVMGVSVELGRTSLTVQEILGLTPGSVVELDRAAGAPVDVLVNGTLIAHGEVVVVDEEFAVRISEVVGPREGRITV